MTISVPDRLNWAEFVVGCQGQRNGGPPEVTGLPSAVNTRADEGVQTTSRPPPGLYWAEKTGFGEPSEVELKNSVRSSRAWPCQTRTVPSPLAVTTSLPMELNPAV